MAKGIITVDTKQIDRLTIELKGFEKQVGEATYHALSRTVDHVKTQIGRIVPKEYAVKSTDVKSTLTGKKPSKGNLTANITSRGHTLSLYHFPHSPQIPQAPGKRYKVKATIKRENGKQTVNTDPKPFVAGLKGGINHVVKREGKERKPIVVLRTLSIPQMLTNDKVADQIQKAAEEKLGERLEHEITRSMTSINKSIKKG